MKSNIQSIGDIISFRIYDTYFHHDVRGHSAGVTLPRSMRVDLFFFFSFFFFFFLRFSYRFSLLFLFVSLFLFAFLLPFYFIFLFWPCLFTETSRAFEKRQGLSRFSELNFSSYSFPAFESFWCPPSMCLRNDAMCIQGHSTGTYKEININRIRE